MAENRYDTAPVQTYQSFEGEAPQPGYTRKEHTNTMIPEIKERPTDRKMTKAERKQANHVVKMIKSVMKAERKAGITPEKEAQYKELEAMLKKANTNTSGARQAWSGVKDFIGKNLPGIGTLVGGAIGTLVGGPIGGIAGSTAGGMAGQGLQKAVDAASGNSGDLFKGTPGTADEYKRYPKYSPEQMKIIDQLGPYGLQLLQNEGNYQPLEQHVSELMQRNMAQPSEEALAPYQNLLNQRIGNEQQSVSPYEQMLQKQLGQTSQPFNFQPFREQAQKNFQENTLPGIFERFNTLGKGAQSTGAFQGMAARGGADLESGLSALEQQYNLKNRALDQNQLQLMQSILGQQQSHALQGQQVAGGLLGQQQGYGISKGQLGNQQQQLAQGLLGQQQNYGLANRGMGLDILNQGLRSPYNDVLQEGQPAQQEWWKTFLPKLLETGAQVAGAYIGAKR